MRIAVLGGGIAGLSTAFHLRRNAEVVVFEAADRLGGNIRTEPVAGCRVEWGPHGFLDNEPATLELVHSLGLTGRLVRARPDAALRFVWRAGKLRRLPTRPPQFLLSRCLPLRARLRVLREPKAPPPPPGDESGHDIAVRRVGPGAAVLVAAV
ncbi:MAG: protoporphyrinogen/coproporphyrinogen oxidase, partial [Planctomycetota bacterium]